MIWKKCAIEKRVRLMLSRSRWPFLLVVARSCADILNTGCMCTTAEVGRLKQEELETVCQLGEEAAFIKPDDDSGCGSCKVACRKKTRGCFSGESTVQKFTHDCSEGWCRSRVVSIPMRDIKIGDMVQTWHGYEEVLGFGHSAENEKMRVIRLHASHSNGSLEASADHMIYIVPKQCKFAFLAANHECAPQLLAMEWANPAIHSLVQGKDMPPINFARLGAADALGVYHPHTGSGTLYVNGFLVACHTTSTPLWVPSVIAALSSYSPWLVKLAVFVVASVKSAWGHATYSDYSDNLKT